jgi:hypothetical protein
MDQSTALGGLMMLVIASLWVVVFIPSWFHNRVNRQHNRQGEVELKSRVEKQIATTSSSATSNLRRAADRGEKLTRTKNSMSVLATLSMLGVATSVFFALQNPLLFVATGFSVLVALVSLLVAIKASNELHKLLIDVAHTRTEIAANVAKAWTQTSPVVTEVRKDERLWTPNPLPSPATRSRKGELEMPQIASVTEINHSGKNFDTQNEINKILRRRRASA